MEKKTIPHNFRQQHPKNKKNKTVLVFDEKKREEFLTGFRKRKNERRKKAQEDIIKQLKEEKRNKRREIRESRHKEVHSKHCQPIPDVDSLVEKQTYDLSSHTVTVTDITGVDIAGSGGYMLGTNQEAEEEETANGGSSDEEGSDKEQSKSDAKKRKKSGTKTNKFNPKRHKNLSHLMGKKGAKNKRGTQKPARRKPKKARNPTS